MKLAVSLCLRLVAAAVFAAGSLDAHAGDTTIYWDTNTIHLVEAGGAYGRMIRLRSGELLCSFESQGKAWVRKSADDGKNWSAPVEAATFGFGLAANPSLLQLQNGKLMLFYNERPHDGRSPFSIQVTFSIDNGATWRPRVPPVYVGDDVSFNGCWEPTAIQLPDGEIQLFFANENPYRNSDEQEITLMRSRNNGKTWAPPETVSFRKGHRDGMPAPLMLRDDKGSAVAIEDNGLTPDGQFKPAIIYTAMRDNWRQPFAFGGSTNRWSALKSWPAHVYAGGPYLCQLPDGEVLLSCQSNEGRLEPQMVVYVGNSEAKAFGSRSMPFPLPTHVAGLWNSLFVKNAKTVTAISTTTINGIAGVWTIDGRVARRRVTGY